MFDWFENQAKRDLEHDKAIAEEKDKLLAEPCMDVPVVNDKILLSAGFLCRGFVHELLECRVVEIGATAYKVAVQKSYDKTESYHWIPSNLIREVIRSKP